MNFSRDIVCNCLSEDITYPKSGPPVSFIVDDGTADGRDLTKCLLCDIGSLTAEAMNLQSVILKNLMIYMMISIKSWRCRTEHARYFLSHYVTIVIAMSDQISCVDWKREIQAKLYGFMVAPPKYLLIEDGRRPYCEDREMELLERPTKKLKTVLHNERLTLLGLAVCGRQCAFAKCHP
jgi:hypothetical protein